MQITLIQTEIEEAIRDYVSRQLTVREGMRIDIELKATRGAEGYQAFIDIVDQDSERKPSEEQAQDIQVPIQVQPFSVAAILENAAAAATKKVTATATRRTPKAATVEPKPEPEVEAADAAEDDGVQREDDTAGEDDTSATVGVDEDSAEEAPPAPTRSLFGGLTRPQNS